MENIAKSTSYGCYLDCDFETAKYPDDKTHIVGLLAEYVYDLEQRILHYDERYIKLWNEIETLRECVSKEFDQEQKISDLEVKLAECEKSKESYRLQNEHHHLQLLQFYSRLGVEAFGADIHEKALETLMIMKEELEEKNGVERALSACNRQNDEFAEMIKKLVSEKEELKQQLAEKEKSLSIKSVVRTLVKDNNLNCTFRDKTNAQIQQCGDVYNSNYGYFNFEDDYDESLNNKTDNRFDITSIDLTDQDKISFAVEQLEQIRKEFEIKLKCCKWEDKMLVGKFCNITNEIIDNTINVLRNNKDGIH